MQYNHPIRSGPQGYILVLALVFLGIFTATATAYISSLTASARSAQHDIMSAQALAIAEGALDSAAAQLNQNPSYAGETNTALGSGVFTVTVTNIDSNTKRITATASVPNATNPQAVRTIKANIALGNSVVSFHYGIQAGNGGFILNNSSKIIGNVFASGPVIGNNNNIIYGDVVSAGAGGQVYGIHATSSVFSHTIGKTGFTTVVDKDAYYMTKVNTTVSGTSFPNSPDQAIVDLPITDAQIAEWEGFAEAGGTITACDASGDYNITTSVSLGPKKLPVTL